MSKKFPSYKFRVGFTKHGEVYLQDGKWYTKTEVERINSQSDRFNERLEKKREILEARIEKTEQRLQELPHSRYYVGGYYDSTHQDQTVFEAHPNIDAIRYYEGNIQWRTTDGRFLYNPEEA